MAKGTGAAPNPSGRSTRAQQLGLVRSPIRSPARTAGLPTLRRVVVLEAGDQVSGRERAEALLEALLVGVEVDVAGEDGVPVLHRGRVVLHRDARAVASARGTAGPRLEGPAGVVVGVGVVEAGARLVGVVVQAQVAAGARVARGAIAIALGGGGGRNGGRQADDYEGAGGRGGGQLPADAHDVSPSFT